MIGHRDGAAVTICDECYRPKRTGEDGWSTRIIAGARAAQPLNGQVRAAAVEIRQANRTHDTCPSCQRAPGPEAA